MAEAATAVELKAWRAGIESADWVHLNSAGAAPTHQRVHDEMVAFLELERRIGGYAAAAKHRAAAKTIDARILIGQLLNCDPDEVALCESAQVAWAKAVYSMNFRPGDRILCWTSEYAGNAVAFLQQAKRSGAIVEVLPMLENGCVDTNSLKLALSAHNPGRCLVALTHVQTRESTIQPAREVRRGVLPACVPLHAQAAFDMR